MRINRISKKIAIIGVVGVIIASASFFFWESGLYKEKKITIQGVDDKAPEILVESEDTVKNDALEEVEEKETEVIPVEQEKVSPIEASEKKEEKKSAASPLKIIANSVNWGYETSVSRKISAIIIHSSYDALGNDPYNFKGLLAEYKSYGVSPHYVIDREGIIYQLVADKNIAYHAGKSRLPNGETDVNGASLGVELMNTEKDSYTAKQYQALKGLIAGLKKNYPIKYVLGHKDIAPGRKTDPWNFDWDKL